MNYVLAVLSVLASYVFVLAVRPRDRAVLRLMLAFSGAFLLALTIFELLPEVYSGSDPRTIGLFIMLGILLQVFLEFFSKGAEHGHLHFKVGHLHFPWLLFASLSLHALLEGFPIERHGNIIYGIVVHKIPIAVLLSVFLLNSGLAQWKTLSFIVFFALMTPLGAYLATHFSFAERYHAPITAMVVGVFLHISTVILFESSEGHRFNLGKLVVIALGIGIAYLM